MVSFNDLEYTVEELKKQYNRLLELCMYVLISSTKIYNHELDTIHQLKFMSIIRENLNDDTSTLRKKIINYWENGGDE